MSTALAPMPGEVKKPAPIEGMKAFSAIPNNLASAMKGGEEEAKPGEEIPKVQTLLKEGETLVTAETSKVDEPAKTSLLDTLAEKPRIKPTKEDSVRQIAEAKEAAERRAKDLERQLEETKLKAAGYDELQVKYSTLEKEAKGRFFDSTDEAKTFSGEKEKRIAAAKELSKELNPDVSDLVEKALMLKGSERRRFIDENIEGAAAVAEFTDALNGIEGVDAARSEAVEKFKASAEPLTFGQQAETFDADAFEGMQPVIAEKLGSPFETKKGDDTHNAHVAANIQLARSLADGTASKEDRIAASYLAVAAKDYMQEVTKLRTENEKLLKRIKDGGLAEPSIGGRDTTDAKENGGKPEGMLSHTRKMFGRK